ncbi:MAG TPA: MASE4 domain-containing protein [Stellaceae bacterium]|nr:MASE4 domain-containing protein [Stellaceae bacterium]
MQILPGSSAIAALYASGNVAGTPDLRGLRHPDALLSGALAGPWQRHLAFGMIAVSVLAFFALAPFAKVPLIAVPAFIPAYEAALVVLDVITAVLLFGQFSQLRSPALLVLGAGYLFDGLLVIPHALSFPGLLTPTGWLGAGAQTTAWLYMFWHGGFPIFVLAYAGLKRRARRRASQHVGAAAAAALIIGVVALAALLTLLATAAEDRLPAIMAGNGYTPAMILVIGTVWALSGIALLALLLNLPYAVLDLWLIVVLVAWLCDIALSAGLNAGRFDLGFYAGRAYGLLAVSFVLSVVLVVAGGIGGRLAAATGRLEAYAGELDQQVRARTGELTQTNRQLRAILRSSPLAIFMLDLQGKVLLWNTAAERIFGYREAEALGLLPPYLDDESKPDFLDRLAQAIDGAEGGAFETQRRRRDGLLIDVSVRWARVSDDAGQLLGIMYAVADITERKKLERQLQQAQKMEAVGNLAGGMAHDFNNLLGVVILNVDVLRDRLADNPEGEELTGEVMTAALRGADLIRRLLAFARRQPLQPQRSDVNHLVAEITKLLERTLGEDIRISLDLGAGLWPVVVDPAQLEASLTNLATNARDAMPRGGELAIVTDNRRLDEDYASQHAEVVPGDYAMIEVSDNGSGMPPEVLAQVFEPFFTTKEAGRGTGLGLSMVYGFTKQSGGHINIYSEVGVGTTVRLYLPRADAAGAQEEAAATPAIVRGSGETVLAVEDNPGLRRVVARQLSEFGYRVIEAEDANAALAAMETAPVALLFSDVVLPGGTSGYDLARAALARWPTIKVLLTSGFPEGRHNGNDRLPQLRLLSKPYRKEELARAVANALNGNGAT